MTNGTSQGLFVVVAIVIFGVFVALSYTVFGSDGLSGSLNHLVYSGTNKTINTLNTYEDVDFEFTTRPNSGDDFELHSISDNSIEYTSQATRSHGTGIRIQDGFLEENTEYKISFDITLLEGTIANIGGHLHISAKQDVYIDGVLQKEMWRPSVPFNNIEGSQHVEIHFNTDYMTISESGLKVGTFMSEGVSTSQPAQIHLVTNRSALHGELEPHRVRFDNIQVQRVVNSLGRTTE